jgi:vancomycin resistance protein YoaR
MVELDAGRLRAARDWGSRWAALALALAILIALLGAFVLVRAVMLRSAVLPGVNVAGIDVGGLSRADARAKIEATLGPNLGRPVTVVVGTREFTTRPSRLYELDVAATEAAAYAEARGSFLSRLTSIVLPFAADREVDPVLRVLPRGRQALAERLSALTRRPVSARVAMQDVTPVVFPGRFGAVVDEPGLIAALRRTALSGSGTVRVALERKPPAITTAEARGAAADAEQLVSAPVTIRFRGEEVGRIWPRTLAGLVRFQPSEGGYNLVLAQDGVGRAVGRFVASATRKPVDATFAVSGNHVRVVRSRGGTRLASTKGAAAILAAGLAPGGARAATVTLTKQQAELTTRDARALGIKRRISTFTTDMGVSSSNRIHNVLLMGQYLDGTIVRPGQTFSFNGTIGPRTAERGFLEGQMILGGLLVPSIGGGVCQVATTIFNAAFEAGLPIRERHNHSFYISHYPMGRDATVSWGGPDFVFRNDLDHAILIKASGNSSTLTVTFYGTRQGRKVIATTSAPTAYTSPTLQYAVDPSAPAGSVRTEPGGGPGFSVSVHRKVLENGKVIRQDNFFTRYTPQNPTAVYGPGKTPPGPYFTLPG